VKIRGCEPSPLTDEPEFDEIDRDHLKVANCLQIAPAQIGTTLGREAERRRTSARHVDAVIMPAQEEILAQNRNPALWLAISSGNRAEAARVRQRLARV
jgi:hypothetical protein